MTQRGWFWVNALAQLLERDDCEVVLGDLAESGEGTAQALGNVLGLLLRRQAAVWKNWRPWLAAFGLALPGSFLLMGFSLSVSRAYQQMIGPAVWHATGFTWGPGFTLLLCNAALLIGWGWSGGFVVGSISRRTLWVSAVLTFAPCLFCLERFRIESLSRFCLLLFLPAAIWGVRQGLAVVRIKRSAAILLALGLTALTIPAWSSQGAWLPNWALSWPAWYLVAIARTCAPVAEGHRDGE